MIVERVWTANPYRNFNYLVVCPDSGEALAIDPLDHQQCAARAAERGWQITQILNTHEHLDHIGGNEALRAATGARVLAHAGAKGAIQGLDRGLEAGDVVRVGRVELRVLDTPGHTMSHVCLLAEGDAPALFSGDTLFNAGAGNCHNGGHPEVLYATFAEQLSRLPDETRLYPGHEYLANNLRFTLDREPGNQAAAKLLEQVASLPAQDAPVTTLGQERQVNTFFRLGEPAVIEALRASGAELPEPATPKDVFLALRALRNRW